MSGLALNNPGNIENSNITYKGEVSSSSQTFKQFARMQDGFRAMASLLYNYINSHGYNTLNKITAHYAPAGDGANNPVAYAKFVGQYTNIDPDQVLSTADFYPGPLGANMQNIIRWMARDEDGVMPDEQALSDGYNSFLKDEGLT